MKIIAGLGNPGEEYKLTRHNYGFIFVDALAKRLGLSWQVNKKLKAEIAKNSAIILVKPLTFMNNSGQAVKASLSYFKLLPKRFGLWRTAGADLSEILTIAHDDLDIDFGRYKVALDRSSAGHKGVASAINYLKTQNFKRLRFGIKTAALEKIPADRFVLQKFDQTELKIIDELILRAMKEI